MRLSLIPAVVAILCALVSAQLINHDRLLGRLFGNPNDESDQVTFYIATRQNPDKVTIPGLNETGNIFEKTNLDLRRKTIVIIHGILSSAKAQWVQDLQDALLDWVI